MSATSRTVAAVCLLVFLGAPAAGQTVGDRVAAVRQQRAEAAANSAKARQARLLQALLYTELTVEFAATPAREALEYIATALGVNLVARYTDEPPGSVPSIDPAAPITLNVKQMPAIDVLELVLEACSATDECTWQLRSSFVEVGSKDRLSAADARQVRIYPIDALIFEPPMFEDAPSQRLEDAYRDAYAYNPWIYPGPYGTQGGYSGSFTPGSPVVRQGGNSSDEQRVEELIKTITSIVEPSGWQRNGGTWATIRYEDGALIVSAPDFIQRQIGGYPKVQPPTRPAPAKPAGNDAP